MSRIKSIESLWSEFEREVIPVSAGAIQRQEMQSSFYAGADAIMQLLQFTDDVPEAEVVEILDGIEGELSDFVEEQAKTG